MRCSVVLVSARPFALLPAPGPPPHVPCLAHQHLRERDRLAERVLAQVRQHGRGDRLVAVIARVLGRDQLEHRRGVVVGEVAFLRVAAADRRPERLRRLELAAVAWEVGADEERVRAARRDCYKASFRARGVGDPRRQRRQRRDGEDRGASQRAAVVAVGGVERQRHDDHRDPREVVLAREAGQRADHPGGDQPAPPAGRPPDGLPPPPHRAGDHRDEHQPAERLAEIGPRHLDQRRVGGDRGDRDERRPHSTDAPRERADHTDRRHLDEPLHVLRDTVRVRDRRDVGVAAQPRRRGEQRRRPGRPVEAAVALAAQHPVRVVDVPELVDRQSLVGADRVQSQRRADDHGDADQRQCDLLGAFQRCELDDESA